MPVRPLLKPTSPAYEIEDLVHIPREGEALEIEDPDGAVRVLLRLLDGTRSIEEIQAEFRRQAPGSDFDVSEAIAVLNGARLLIDAGAADPLDEYGRQRWRRNLGFFETYATLDRSSHDMQQALRDCKVALLGVGGVGSHVALDLLGLGVQDLRIVDFDKVELSNLNRQILYEEADLGQPKVERALRRLTGYSARASVTGLEKRLESAADVADVVRDRDIVICAADRPKMQVIEWVNQGCVASGVPFIAGGVETQRSVLYLVVPGETGCVECWRRTAADDTYSRAIRIQMADLHTDGGIGPDRAAFGGLVTVLTGMMISELVRFITGVAEPIALGKLIEIHFDDLVPRTAEQWKRISDCPVCGEVEGSYRYRRSATTG